MVIRPHTELILLSGENKKSQPVQKDEQKPAQKPAQKTESKPVHKDEQKSSQKQAAPKSAQRSQKPASSGSSQRQSSQKPAQKTSQKPASSGAPSKPAASKPAPKPASATAPVKSVPNKVTVQTSAYNGEKQGVKKNKPVRTKESTKKQSMLNTHKLSPFKYDMNEILNASSMDPAKASSFLASVIAKASRISTKTAKEFVKTYLDAGDLTKDEYDKICKLLDRYSKFR